MTYYQDREEEVIRPEPVVMPAPAPEPEKKEEDTEDDTSDLFRVEKEDISDLADISDAVTVTEEDVMGEDDADMSDDVLELPEEEDMSDLFEVGGDTTNEPKKPVAPRRFKRTTRRYEPPLGGVRGIRE